LLLDQLSLRLDSGSVQFKITPLSERVLRTAAPDTYTQLHALQARLLAEPFGVEDTEQLFLVSVFTRQTEGAFSPEALRATSGARQFRAERVVGITPGWADQRIGGTRSESAIYRFDEGMELERDLVFLYGQARSGSWSAAHAEIEAELVRARARSGGG